jgi:hypothetical protein
MSTGSKICLHAMALVTIGVVMAFLALPEDDKEELAAKMKAVKKKELKLLNKLD